MTEKRDDRTAILITGLLRMAAENEKTLSAISERHDVFVCTARSHERLLPHLGPVKSVRFIEDDPFQAKFEQELFAAKEGVKLLQWQKLYAAYEDMTKVEQERQRPYERVFKLRTDFTFDFPFELPAQAPEPSWIFMQGDLLFGGSRDAFSRIADFIFPAMLEYYRNPNYQKINTSKIAQCDLDAGRFLHLKWPTKVFRRRWFRKGYSREEMKRMIVENAARIGQFGDGESGAYFKKKGWARRRFRSQSSFLHYVLSKDLVVKSFSPKRYKLISDRTRDNI